MAGPSVQSEAGARVLQALVLADQGEPAAGWVALAGAQITGTGRGPAPAHAGPVIDLGSWTIAPGFVDLHVHGGGGAQISGQDPDRIVGELAALASFHARHGTTGLLATTVSEPPERLLAAVTAIRRAVADPVPGAAVVLGAHLEGPWLSPQRRGAHAQSSLRTPDRAELDALIAASGETVRLLTIAPELPGAVELIRHATMAGVRVSVGHTEATCAQTAAAFEAGARHLTHLGNAMPGLDRREPGPIGAALADPRVAVEVIADGHHVHPALLKIAAAAAGDRLVVITDAIAATGMPAGAHRLGDLEVTVTGDRAVLTASPDTLAGSVLTMDAAVRGLVGAGVGVADALRAASSTPARVLGEHAAPGGAPRGTIAAGHRADLVVLDEELRAAVTLVGGQVVHDRDHRLDPDR